jgi:hypothetical protein
MPYIDDEMYRDQLRDEEDFWMTRAERHNPQTDTVLKRSLNRINEIRELLDAPPVAVSSFRTDEGKRQAWLCVYWPEEIGQ